MQLRFGGSIPGRAVAYCSPGQDCATSFDDLVHGCVWRGSTRRRHIIVRKERSKYWGEGCAVWCTERGVDKCRRPQWARQYSFRSTLVPEKINHKYVKEDLRERWKRSHLWLHRLVRKKSPRCAECPLCAHSEIVASLSVSAHYTREVDQQCHGITRPIMPKVAHGTAEEAASIVSIK